MGAPADDSAAVEVLDQQQDTASWAAIAFIASRQHVTIAAIPKRRDLSIFDARPDVSSRARPEL